jgi:Yip1-like protein
LPDSGLTIQKVPSMNQTAPPPAPAQGLIARAIGIITSPKATYEAVVRSPRPFGILLLCAVIIGLAQTIPQLTERGRQAALEMQVQQSERWSGKPVTDEQYRAMEQWGRIGAYVGGVFVLVGLTVWCLLQSAIYWAVFNALLGGTATFKQVLAVVNHSLVIGALGIVISAPIMLYQGTMSVGGPFNFGALMPMLDEAGFLARFLGIVNVFTIWGLIVLAIGLGVLYRRKTANIAIGLFLAFGIIGAAFIAATSR